MRNLIGGPSLPRKKILIEPGLKNMVYVKIIKCLIFLSPLNSSSSPWHIDYGSWLNSLFNHRLQIVEKGSPQN